MGLIFKRDFMNVTDLTQAVRHLCLEDDVCCKLLKHFHDYCLFNKTGQIVMGIVFSCFCLKNYKNVVFRYSMTSKQFFCVGELLKYWKKVWKHSNGVCTTIRYHTEKWESWQIDCVFRLSLGLFTLIMEFKYKQAYKMIERGVLTWKSKIMKPYHPIFNLLW